MLYYRLHQTIAWLNHNPQRGLNITAILTLPIVLAAIVLAIEYGA